MFSVLIVCSEINELLIASIKSVIKSKCQIIINISSKSDDSLGARKNRLISEAAYDWVLILDTDEIISTKLLTEIHKYLSNESIKFKGFQIPYNNIAFGKSINHGGELFSKTRLFLKSYGHISNVPIHEEVNISGDSKLLTGVIYHYSYRNIIQVIIKFTKYSWLMAGEMQKRHENVTLKKLFLYGPHMVWARAIKDEGWRDGWRGVVLALCFGYMETLMYWMLLWRNIFHR